nr:hypothetical protein [Tanacetum cinerariifolium]
MFVYEQEPSYNKNYNDNYYPHDLSSFLCCDNCGGSHETFQCQPMDQNNDSSGFDQIQLPQYPVIHHPSQEMSGEVLQAKENLIKSILTFLEKFNRYPFGIMPKVLSQAWEKLFEIQHAQPEDTNELFQKLLEDLQIIREELAEYINSPSWNYPTFYDDEEYSIQYKEYLEKSPDAITTVLPTKEPEYSLSMGYEHLSTTPKMELDEVIKSSAKNLLPIPSEYDVTFDDESECDVPIKDESSPAFTFFQILFSMIMTISLLAMMSHFLKRMFRWKISKFIQTLFLTMKKSILISWIRIEFSGELTHINPILPRIKEVDFDLEEEICLVENLLYDNSSPRPPEELNAKIADTIVESLSPSPIPVENGNFLMDEIDLFLATDDLLPLGIESDDYDSEGDIHFLKELLLDDPISLPENESFYFDYQDDPLFPRPHLEPPNVEVVFHFEPNSEELIAVVMNNIDELNEDECFDP